MCFLQVPWRHSTSYILRGIYTNYLYKLGPTSPAPPQDNQNVSLFTFACCVSVCVYI